MKRKNAAGGTRTHTREVQEPKSCASANSATAAYKICHMKYSTENELAQERRAES